MKAKELTKLYESEKAKYKADIQNDNGSYTCKGCDCNVFSISIHHIIKRSKLKYFYADPRNFIELCDGCHILAEGTVYMQQLLNCFDEMEIIKEALLKEYYSLKPYEQSLLFKYG